MGTDEVTIDFNGVLEWGDLMAIEEKANGMIWENLEISAVYPEKDELDAMEYRSKKELTGAVRIVSIPEATSVPAAAPMWSAPVRSDW